MSLLDCRVAAVLLSVVVASAGCSPSDPSVDPVSSSPPPSTAASPSATATPDEPAQDATTDDLAGEPFDGPPLNGMPASVLVIGVAADDVLNVRSGPGVEAGVVATLAPLATDVPATGRARLLPDSIWAEVRVDGGTGWVNSSFLAFPGATQDITAQLVEQAGGRPNAGDLEALGEAVAALVASEEPPSRVVISDGPTVGDLGEVTVDVIGLGDDAVRGLRLLVFAEEDGDGFTMRTVEATSLCARAPGDDDGCP